MPSDIEEARGKSGNGESMFFLRISYATPEIREVESIRPLGGYMPDSLQFVANKGNTLT